MKKLLVILCIVLCQAVIAAEEEIKPAVQNPLTVPQNITYENCTKLYGINQEKLLYLTLASLSANRFNIDEIQTANGYIIFSANRNKYLATIAKIDDKNSMLKITPCNNIYRFPGGILLNTFKYIDLNLVEGIK